MKATSNSSAVGHGLGGKLALRFLDAIRKSNDESIEMKAIDALKELCNNTLGASALPVYQGFCEAIMESLAAGEQINRDALGRDLADIAAAALGICKIAADDDLTEEATALQALGEKVGYLADSWLPRIGHGLIVGDTFEDWRTIS